MYVFTINPDLADKVPQDQTGPDVEPLTRTSLQSFHFLPQNPRTPRPVMAVEITRTSLQLLEPDLFYSFYYDLPANHDYVLHIPGDPNGILSDTCALDKHLANVYFLPAAVFDNLSSFLLSICLSYSDERFDRPNWSNTSVSLDGDYVAGFYHIQGR
ncbi:MAG: hypothetical protein WDZ47_01240 [Bacteroidales bacterium]